MRLFRAAITDSIIAYQKYSVHPDRAVRLWDKKTPYAVHPLWCAMTFLQETNLPESVNRRECAFALLFHDVKEDSIELNL